MQHSLDDNIDRTNYLEYGMDARIRYAIQVARKFLEQYNSPVVFKSANLQGDICDIVMDVGLTHEKIIQVKINAITGTIVSYRQ